MYPSRLAFLWPVRAWQSPAHSAWKQGNRGGSARRADWAKQSEWMQRTESVQCGLRQNLREQSPLGEALSQLYATSSAGM